MQAFLTEVHLASLLKASGQAAVLILLVLAVQWALGRRLTPRWRYALWLLVAARLALPWTVPSPVSVFNLLRFPQATLAAPVPSTSALAGASASATAPSQPAAVRAAPASTAPAMRLHAQGPWLLAVWLAGALVLATWLALTHYRLWRRVTPRRPLIDARVMNLLEDCKQTMGLRVPVTLVETSAVSSPSLFGFVRPRLLLPTGLTGGFSQEELRHVFLHELSHIKRLDILMGWLMTALQIVHWFNPLVWLAAYRMRVDRELACDALALSYAGEEQNQPYGRTIIKLLEGFGGSAWTPSLAGTIENKNQMKERIRMIAKFTSAKPMPALAGVLFIGLGLVTLTDARQAAPQSGTGWVEQKVQQAEAGNQWAAYHLWDTYYRGKQGVQADSAEADKWLGQFVRGLSVVRFEPVDDFTPTNPQEFLARIRQYSPCQSGQTNVGAAGFFRTTKQGNKLIGSFLSNYPDQLKSGLEKVPGLKIISVEQLTPQAFVQYEQSPQESLTGGAGSQWSLEGKLKLAEAGNKWAVYDLWNAYYRGKNGVQPDPVQADKWLGELVQDLWVVRFGPVDNFAPTDARAFLERIHQYSSCYSGQTNIGAASFFRTTKQGDKLIGSFLSNYPDQLRSSLEKAPGLKVISVEQITPQSFIQYEQSSQESLAQTAAPAPKPNIVTTSPRSGTKDVDPSLQEITITFDQDMSGGYSWTGSGPDYPTIPEGQKAQWRDKRTCVLPVKLEPGHYYRVGINSKSYHGFQTTEGVPADPSAIRFTTQGATPEQQLQMQPPRIVGTSPAVGATEVDPATGEITVTFDQEMGDGISWTGGGPEFPAAPEGQKAQWRDTHTCVLPVKLEAGHFYRVGINSTSYQNFANAHGVAALPSAIYFTTQGATDQLKARTLLPHVVACDPYHGAQNVSPAVTEVRVTFDVPMGGGMSWCTVSDDGTDFPKGPKGKRSYWTEDKLTCVLPVELQPGMTYRISLNAPEYKNFQSAGGVPLEPVEYTFKTAAN